MKKIRYSFIKSKVNNLFIKCKISSYPIDIFEFVSNFDYCKIVSYSEHMKKYNLSENEVILHFGSDEGCTFYNPKKKRYLIFYNDLNIFYKAPVRRRWTLAHELGHVFLNHLTITNKVKIFRSNLTDDEYQWLETEANRFASLFLANPIILHCLNIQSNIDIMQICKISEEASSYRYSDYLKWRKNKHIDQNDLLILKHFYNFIYKKHCPQCGDTIISKEAKYCSICGNNGLIRGDGNMKFKEGVQLYENNHAKICPHCENEDITSDDIYCHICGAYLIQRCSDITNSDINGNEYIEEEGCGNISMKSNSRFCSVCGHKSTFYEYGYLKSWEKEKSDIVKAQEEIASALEPIIDGDIPF